MKMEDRSNEKQLELLEGIQEAGYNIVTCGNCGDVFIHKCGVDGLICPWCNYDDDICQFPDLYY